MSRRSPPGRGSGRRRSGGERPERIAHQIHSLLAVALREEIKDPRLSAVSITGVRVSRDLTIAHVNVVPLGGQGDGTELIAGLEAASGFLRRVVGAGMRLRHTPLLRFHLDEGLDDSLAMTSRLMAMEAERAAREAEEEAAAGEAGEPGESEAGEGGEA